MSSCSLAVYHLIQYKLYPPAAALPILPSIFIIVVHDLYSALDDCRFARIQSWLPVTATKLGKQNKGIWATLGFSATLG